MFEELSLSILDIAMNSLTAGARTVSIAVLESRRHDWLILRVHDDGHGMDERTAARAFELFFTTRADQGGSGVGLALCREIVEQLGGSIELRSRPGKGTRVTLHLPVA